MGCKFYADESIEYPFFLQMGQERGGRRKTDLFSRKVYFDGCRCPSCGKSKAVMKRSRRNDAFLRLCPVETCSLKVLTLHYLIKRCGTPALFEEWRKARWKKNLNGGPVADKKLEEMIWVQSRGGCVKVKCVRSCSSLVCSLFL